MPKVSIVLPTHNGEKFIEKAIQSVFDQSFSDWELIVINDASTDETPNMIKKLSQQDSRVVYFRNEKNLGIQKSLNKGLREAKGEYIARIDDDDEWLDKTKLQNQVEFLDKNPDYVLVGTDVVVVSESGKELFRYLNPEKDFDIRQKILGRNCFSHSSVVFKKQAALKAGLYPETQKTLHAEDYWFWLKLGLEGKFRNLPFYGIRFMLRKDAISSKNKIKQFWHDILVVWEFRNKYPNFLAGFIRSWLRLILYGLGGFLPFLHLKYWAMKKYKSL